MKQKKKKGKLKKIPIFLILFFGGHIQDGERESRDEKNRECDKQASDIFEEKKWVVEEGSRALGSLRCPGCCDRLLTERQAL